MAVIGTECHSGLTAQIRLPMAPSPYKVIVVVDPEFGERLTELPVEVPVWIVDTPINTSVAHRLWQERPQPTHLTGITTFQGDLSASPEAIFIDELDMIDL